MKSTIAAATTTLALVTSAVAQFTNQSAPFFLVLHSDDEAYNGTALGSCHEGAAIEGLCTGYFTNASTIDNTFQFNASSAAVVANADYGAPGYLTYLLEGSNFNVSEPMSIFSDLSTNVGLPLFEPSEPNTEVAFDIHNRMNIQTYLDDTVTPPTDATVRALYRWHVCETNQEGYTYETLAWVLGNRTPENPSCKKVQVIRQFV